MKIKWYQFVVMNHDYLLAAIVLCLDVMNMRFVAGSNIPHCVITESDKLEALRVCYFQCVNVLEGVN